MDNIIASGLSTVQSSIAMGVLASIGVALRYLAKAETKAGLAADDYWIAISLGTYWAGAGVMLWGVYIGGGGLNMHNFIDKNQRGIATYSQALVIYTCLQVTSLTTVKLAIICYYRRVFSVQLWFRRCTIILGGLCICWWITALLGIVLSCVPLQKSWNPEVKGHCMNLTLFFLILAIVDIIHDFTLLCLPIWVIFHLQLQIKHRMSVAVCFLLGGFVCISAIIRIKNVYNPPVTFVKGIMWGNIHSGIAIICACLPSYRPLIIKWSAILPTRRQQSIDFFLFRFRSNRSIKKSSSTKTTAGSDLADRFHHGQSGDQIRIVEVVGGAAKSEDGLEAHEGQSANSITVQKTFHII